MFRKLKRYLKDPYYEIGYDMLAKHPNWMPDKYFIKVMWQKASMGYELNLKNPKTYNEKLQWLKLYDHNPLYPILVDKIKVKEWVTERVGEEYIIPTLAVYSDSNEIDLDKLPNQFVLKCNHDSGSVTICRDKTTFNLLEAKNILNNALRHNYYYDSREWPYKNIKPKILAEPYIETHQHELPDYKFFVFNGKVKYLFIATDRQSKTKETKFDFYDVELNHLDVTNGHPNSSFANFVPPRNFPLMIDLAEKLCKELPHVRCDLYNVDGKIYFGEMTFYHWSGFVPFNPHSFDVYMGNLLKLPFENIE